jgi:ActR/RegA family two-component response regulator
VSKQNRHVGSSLEDFLKEEGTLEETRSIAIKETIAFQIQRAMEMENISKVEMARRMNTSRAALDRFLAPGSASVTLQTLARAARAIGRDLRIELV